MAVLTQVVTLADVRTYLRYPDSDTDDDASLTDLFIPAATDALTDLCGDIVPQQYDEYYDGGDFSVWLRHFPVLSVANVNEGWGWTDYDLSYVQVNSILPAGSNIDPLFAYSLDDPEAGQITRRSAGNVNIPFMPGTGNIRVTYTAGRESVPGGITLAACELIRHWWSGSQQRSAGAGTAFDATDTDFTRSQGQTSVNLGVPYAIIRMVQRWRKPPVIG